MLIYVRHGKTSHNKGGSEERLRGWLPLPLTPEGIAQSHAVGSQLSIRPDTFTTSDLPRAAETAQIIGEHLGLTPTADERLRDWNTGSLAGQKVTDALPALKGLIHEPDQPAPDGESVSAYLARFVPAVKEAVTSPGTHLMVGHARGASVIEGLASPEGGAGQDVDRRFMLERPTLLPGGVMTIGPQWQVKMTNPGEHAKQSSSVAPRTPVSRSDARFGSVGTE